jgi:biotin carboxyl carrier protein
MANQLISIISPISGVFYRKPAPDEPPFVEVGTEVKKGQPLGLLETMKVFTKIKSTAEGIVEEILLQDEETVAKGQVIFHLKPKG